MGDGVQVMVADQTRQGHGHGGVVCGFEREVHVFQPQPQFEPGRLKTLLGDDFAVVCVDRRVEEPVQDLEKLLRGYAGFAHQRNRFPMASSMEASMKLVAILVRLARQASSPNTVTARPMASISGRQRHPGRRSGGDNPQLLQRRRIRPSQNGRRYITLAARGVYFRQFL